MRRAAIVSPLRTAVGVYGGSLRPVPVETMIATVIKALIERTRLDTMMLDDVIIAQSYANGEAPCIGRYAVLEADLPIEIPGYQLDRRCGSGLQAVINAAMMVQTGAADVVLAGGVESMSNVEYYTTDMRWGKRAGSVTLHDRLQRGRERSQPERRFGHISGMIETAENLAKEYNITREESDAYAMRSHLRAAQAWKTGRFKDEILPISVPQAKGDPKIFAQDEGYRPDASMETLAKLRPIIKNGTVTASNASQQNDAAAACLVVAEDKLKKLELEPMGYLVGWAAAGCHPATMGIGPVPAVTKLFARTGLGFGQMDLVELNEAFACQVLSVLKGWGWNDPDRLNVNGSGISLGHPVGATGVRILTTMLHELRRRKAKYALETMCVGSGQGLAAIFER
ncbi:MAG: acetyl-CoA acetyltransferase [Betaproteobacteria bacterium RIFCSPLOWO2_12_FULL_62_13]|nr:MAG: acetyl-CoA acetyltransferase [Betaproteobacteria bacterium RIFCSPLOWO2_12_FULL_62_13]